MNHDRADAGVAILHEGSADEHVICLQKQPIMKAPSPEFMLHSELGKYGFHGDVIDDIYESLVAK